MIVFGMDGAAGEPSAAPDLEAVGVLIGVRAHGAQNGDELGDEVVTRRSTTFARRRQCLACRCAGDQQARRSIVLQW